MTARALKFGTVKNLFGRARKDFMKKNGLEALVPRFYRFNSWNLCEII